MVSSGRLINFDKYRKLSTVAEDIQRLQSVKYRLEIVPEIQDYLIQQLKDSRDVQELHDLSLNIEPRERVTWMGEKEEGERVFSLMAEKGFL